MEPEDRNDAVAAAPAVGRTAASPDFPMNAYHTCERDTAAPDDLDAATTLSDARRRTLVDRLQGVTEPSSSVDHLLEHLAGARSATRMTVVDWTLPLARTDGGVALYVVRSDGATAYIGLVGGEFRATPWRTDADGAPVDHSDDAETAEVDPREWFPEDARVLPLPVEATPFDC